MGKLCDCSEVAGRKRWEKSHRWYEVAIWEGGSDSEVAIWES